MAELRPFHLSIIGITYFHCFQHRQDLMGRAKAVLYAPSEAVMGTVMEGLEQAWGEIYPRFLDYMDGLMRRRREWALCLRVDVPTRGHHTNNMVEVAVRVMKDNVLHR